MRLVALLLALLLLAGCEDGGDGGSKPKVDPSVKLVQKRYADCLKKLHAKNAEAETEQVSFDTDAGLLVIAVVERNGKTFTNPSSSEDVRVLKTVGC